MKKSVVSVGVAILGALALASPVQAVTPTSMVATGNGVAGMEQTVSVLAPEKAGGVVSLVATQGQASLNLNVRLNRLGVGQSRWAPPASGTWTISASDGSLKAKTLSVAAMPTITQVAVPTNPTQHLTSPLIATIAPGDRLAQSIDDDVEGTVIFSEVVRGVIGQAKVEMSSDGIALARLDWAPPGVATYAVTAEFIPANDPATGTPVFAPSSSTLAYFTAGTDSKPVQILMPHTMRIGDPANVVVHVDESRRGSVSLQIDGRKVSPDKTVDQGLVTFGWEPVYRGISQVQVVFHELGVEESSTQGTTNGIWEEVDRITLSHVVNQTINVLDRRPANPMSVTPVVRGKPGEPWENDSVVEYSAGSRVRLVTSTGNGAPVVFVITGSCAIDGNTLYLPLTGGGCSVRFSSPGGGGFIANTARVVVSSVVE